jgi:hypothetical protein
VGKRFVGGEMPRLVWSAERRVKTAVACGLACGLAVGLAAVAASGIARAAVACNSTQEQPFLRWFDPAYYMLAPGGAIEPGTNTWALSAGAAIVAGNEPYRVHRSTDNHSLYLPSGSSATTNMVCLGLTYPTLRFFAVNAGSASTYLNVLVYFRSGAGTLLGSATITSLFATSTWAPTSLIPILGNATAPTGTEYVQFRFAPAGPDSGWRIDDVYVDPWSSR